jgi:hypothetical protein
MAMRSCRVAVAATTLLTLAFVPALAAAHGMAGQRFFPSTLTIDDPFVADELSLPTFLHIKQPGDGEVPAGQFTNISGELSKRIFPNFGITLGGEWNLLDPAANNRTESGFGNLEVTLKYQFFTNAAHETILSVAFGWEAGGTGRQKAGAESFDLFKPALLFGKGMGDLPDPLAWLRPFAVTGIVEGVLPSRSGNKKFTVNDDGDLEVEIEKNPNVFHWGFAVMYSLPYLQAFVRDVGLPVIINRLIPLVEIDITNPLDRGFAGKTTGTVNPGIIWAGKYFQLGLEAVVPVNERTGKNVGIRGQVHFFLDDLFPHTFGRPLFGR